MATDSHTPQAPSWLFQPSYFARNDGIGESTQFSFPWCRFFPAVSSKVLCSC